MRFDASNRALAKDNPRKSFAVRVDDLQEIDQATIVTYVEMSLQFGMTDTTCDQRISVKFSPD